MVLGSSSHGGERKRQGTSPYTPVSGDHMWVGPGVGGTRGGALTMHLRLQDFKSVSEYNSDLFKISSQLKLCGENITNEDMLEKTFTTFHSSNVLLQQQYRESRFTKYSELIACLLVAKKNNELLLQNHQSRSIGSKAFLEANATLDPG